MSNQYQRMNNDHTKPEEQYAFFEAEVVEPVAQPNNKPYGPLTPGNYNNYATPPPPVNYNNPAYNNALPGYSNDYYNNNYQPAPGQDVQYPPPGSQNLNPITQPYLRSPPRPTGTTPPPPYLPPTQYQAPVPPAPQQPPYNPAYSSSTYPTNSHLTQPYTRPTMLPHQQAPYTPPPVPPIHSESHSRYNTSSSSSSPLTNSRPPPPTNSRPPPPPPITAAPVYGAKSSGRRRHGRDEDCCEDCCGDCCTVCGCFRFACTLVTIIFGILFIIGGLSLITFSNTLPGKCQGVCDPNGNNGTYVPPQVPSIGNGTVSSVNNTTSDLAGQCSNLCSKGLFDGLHYSGIAMLIIGAIIIGCQLLNMLCRSGGRGSGCCFCC